jgi:hypothetical protein
MIRFPRLSTRGLEVPDNMAISKKQISDVMREIGRGSWSKAGKAAAAKMTPKQRSERARKAVLARWGKARREK